MHIPDGGPTWRRGEHESLLDFAITDKNLVLLPMATRFNDSSDHRPIQFQVEVIWRPMTGRKVIKVSRQRAEMCWEKNPIYQDVNGDPWKLFDPRYARRKASETFEQTLEDFINLQRANWEETWKNWNEHFYSDSTRAWEFLQRLTKYRVKREGGSLQSSWLMIVPS